MTTPDLTTITAAVAQRVWDEQTNARPHATVRPRWDALTPLQQHNALEAVLPIVRATLDVIGRQS